MTKKSNNNANWKTIISATPFKANDIAQSTYDNLAYFMAPLVKEFFNNKENMNEFMKWKENKDKKQKVA